MSKIIPQIYIMAGKSETVTMNGTYLIRVNQGSVELSTGNSGGLLLTTGKIYNLVLSDDITFKSSQSTNSMISAMQVDSEAPAKVNVNDVYLSSIGTAIVGTKNNPFPSYTFEPKGANDFIATWSSSDSTILEVTSTGYNVKTDGSGANLVLTLTNSDGTKASDLSSLTQTTLKAYTESTSAINVGETYQLESSYSPSDLATQFPGEVKVTYTSQDTSIATINSTGLATGVASGDTRLGITVEFRGATASDSSYFQVN